MHNESPKIKFYILTTLVAMLSATGFYIGMKLAGIYVPDEERIPASETIKNELNLLSQKQLINDAEVVQQDASQGIEFGPLFIRDDNSESSFACSVFENLELTFVADGMAVSGELPKMLVSGPCLKSIKDDRIQALMVNKNTIQRTPATDKKIEMVQQKVQIELLNLSDSWPPAWVLNTIRFYNSSGRELIISADEVRNSRPTPLVLNW